jgi:hypothetical protein
MPYNGPAIKGVSVAERMKAGAEKLSRGRVLVPAGMSEAWRGFCRHVASFLSFTSVSHDRAESADREKRASVLASVMVSRYKAY